MRKFRAGKKFGKRTLPRPSCRAAKNKGEKLFFQSQKISAGDKKENRKRRTENNSRQPEKRNARNDGIRRFRFFHHSRKSKVGDSFSLRQKPNHLCLGGSAYELRHRFGLSRRGKFQEILAAGSAYYRGGNKQISYNFLAGNADIGRFASAEGNFYPRSFYRKRAENEQDYRQYQR